MRLPTETERPNVVLANEAGLNYVNIAVNRVALASSQIDEFERVVMRMPGPYRVHCATGARAALLTLLAAAKKNNWTAQQVFSEGGLMGFDFYNTPEYAQFVTRVTTV